jgi:uncharacterized heparinase superfamily protein
VIALPAAYWHTLRYLKPVQLYGRLWYRVARPAPDLRAPPAVRLPRADAWVRPARRAPSLLGPERVVLLNQVRDLTPGTWDDPSLEQLWRYNLHYFDDLNALDAHSRKHWHIALLLRWVQENPPGSGTAWEPYPTSLRIVNWIKWALGGNDLPNEFVTSLAVQARWLTRRLERHLLGNHLFANAKALFFAGSFFEGKEADAWLEQAFRILRREMAEQILEDGGHFERSPMYHALALEDVLDLCNIAATFAAAIRPQWHAEVEGWRRRIPSMQRWLAAMCHPDGEIAFFNDAAVGIAPAPVELERYSERLGLAQAPESSAITVLRPSGYVRLETPAAVALLDVAPVGPDYLPAHAHADTLSFELSLFGGRVLVNSGTSCYGVSEERSRQRKTAAHNTVVVDGCDSSEVWSGFRVARRARPFGLRIAGGERMEVSCSHDGYTRLPGRPVHTRAWRLTESELVIEDRVSGTYRNAQARFHLHPCAAIDVCAENALTLRLPGDQVVRVSVEGSTIATEASTWHSGFGRSDENRCVVVNFNGESIRTRFEWHSGR